MENSTEPISRRVLADEAAQKSKEQHHEQTRAGKVVSDLSAGFLEAVETSATQTETGIQQKRLGSRGFAFVLGWIRGIAHARKARLEVEVGASGPGYPEAHQFI